MPSLNKNVLCKIDAITGFLLFKIQMFSFIHFFEVTFFHENVLHVLVVVWRAIFTGPGL